jgi:hypothetical protein
MDKRKVIWSDCWSRIQAYLGDLENYHRDNTNLIAKESYKASARSIREMLKDDKEFSAVARACVLSAGDPRLSGLLRSR